MLIVQTPLRVSLFGGGTDFPTYFSHAGGCVLSSSIDKYVYVTVNPRFDDQIVVSYTRLERVATVDEIAHDLIREAFRLTGAGPGIEIATMADIPSHGSGLGSSSAITVGALHALYALQGVLTNAERLAKEACYIERDILGQPIGIQDQYIAAYGNLCFIQFQPDGAVDVHRTDIPTPVRQRLSERLLLFYTGIARRSESVLVEQKRNIEQSRSLLDQMKAIAIRAYAALQAGEVDAVGSLLHESWLLKKQLASNVSNPQIDALYHAARTAGAVGGKISGAGGGGFLLLYCPVDRQQYVREALSTLRELPFRFDAYGTRVIFSKLH